MDYADKDSANLSTLASPRVWNYGPTGFHRTHILKGWGARITGRDRRPSGVDDPVGNPVLPKGERTFSRNVNSRSTSSFERFFEHQMPDDIDRCVTADLAYATDPGMVS